MLEQGKDDNNSTVDNPDEDNDGVLNDDDDCPDTAPGAATDTQGCSNEQNKDQTAKTTDDGMSAGMIFMWTLIIGGIVVLVGAAVILLNLKKDEDVDIGNISGATGSSEDKAWEMPVLDGTAEVDGNGNRLQQIPRMDCRTSPEIPRFWMDRRTTCRVVSATS